MVESGGAVVRKGDKPPSCKLCRGRYETPATTGVRVLSGSWGGRIQWFCDEHADPWISESGVFVEILTIEHWPYGRVTPLGWTANAAQREAKIRRLREQLATTPTIWSADSLWWRQVLF